MKKTLFTYEYILLNMFIVYLTFVFPYFSHKKKNYSAQIKKEQRVSISSILCMQIEHALER